MPGVSSSISANGILTTILCAPESEKPTRVCAGHLHGGLAVEPRDHSFLVMPARRIGMTMPWEAPTS